MNNARFFLSCIPPTTSHHHKRIVRVGGWHRLADRPELSAAKGLLEELLIPHQIAEPVTPPVLLVIEFTWPWLASHGKRFRSAGRQPHTSKPDLSNVLKTLEDRLVTLNFLEDDRSVVEVRMRKWWGDTPGIDIAIVSAADVVAAPQLSTVPAVDLFAGLAVPDNGGAHAATAQP